MPDLMEQTDVIVIGSGLAGLSAAVEARMAGAEVAVIEKMKITGGNTRISDGGLAAPCNYLQKKLNVDDSPESLFQDMMAAGLGLNHPDLAMTVCSHAADAVDWTRTKLGVQYLDRLDRFGGHSVARCVTTRSHSGADLIRALVARLKDLGVSVRTGCRLSRIEKDPSGRVTGVTVHDGWNVSDEASGTLKMIHARRAVILATGGFANDTRFRAMLVPGLDPAVQTTNHKGATAEGLIAALKVEAFPVHLSWIQLGPWGCPDEKGYGTGGRFASYSVFPAGILIDPATGSRIVNEWGDRRQRSEAMLKAGKPCIGIVDSKGAEKDRKSLDQGLKKGKIKGFDTMSELAGAFGVPYRSLSATVDHYNRLVAAGGIDPFGKALTPATPAIATPPFYAIRLWPKVHYTPGGIGINSRAQVLDLAGNPIPGLYAAGEVCGGVHGASRLGSCALTECLVFGRIAGVEAARHNVNTGRTTP